MKIELADAVAAEARGYFLPDEDERLRAVFARYLASRAVLLESLDSVSVVFEESGEVAGDEVFWQLRLQAFITGFSAALMLVRSASFMVDLATDRPVVLAKLDEEETNCGIPKKSYTRIYRSLVSARQMWRFHEAVMFYEAHRDDVVSMKEDPVVAELVTLLWEEELYLEFRKRDYLKRRLSYRLHSFKRRNVSGYKKVMFHLLKLSGSAVAEMKQPFDLAADAVPARENGQEKRVTAEVRAAIALMLRPGDVFVTRHDDAMSNLFLPGFWPHAALYIGSLEERVEMGLEEPDSKGCGVRDVRFLEAKKDGVLFRSLEESLKVDALMVLRPRLSSAEVAQALARAMSHEGKLYDFAFDFRKADRLACTEVVYRGYHGIGPIQFELKKHAGRPCISAEDLLEQALGSGHFEKIADFGVRENRVRVF